MNHQEAALILEKMLEGVHPMTGEIFSEDHVCNDPQVIRALHKAINTLRSEGSESAEAKGIRRTRQSRENNKKSWTSGEDTYLRNAYPQGVTVGEMSSELHRSEQNVKQRLVYLDLAERSILGSSLYPENGHAHQGLPWYPEEDEHLSILYNSGYTPKEMSAEMKRSFNSIMCRLEKLGLIEDRHTYTAPDNISF